MGIHIITNTSDIFEIQIAVPVGMLDETPANVEVAHVLEHMLLFQNGKYGMLEFLREMTLLGCYYNGYTSLDRTTYVIGAHKDHFAKCIELIYNIVCNPKIVNDKYFENEKKAVVQELRNRLEGETLVYDKMIGIITGMPLSTEEHVKKITVGRLKRFYKRYYDPARFSIFCNCDKSIVKDVDRMLRKLFWKANSDNDTARVRVGNKHIGLFKADVIKIDDLKVHNLFLIFPFYKRDDIESVIKFQLLDYCLSSSSLNSVLGRVLRTENGLVYSVSSMTVSCHELGFYYINMGASPDMFDKILEICQGIFEDLKDNGFDDEKFRDYKTSFINNMKYHLQTVSYKSNLLSSLTFYGYADIDYIGIIKRVSNDDIKAMARFILDSTKMMIIKS